MEWVAVRHETYEATLTIPIDLENNHLAKLLEKHEDRHHRKLSLDSRTTVDWEVLQERAA